MTDPSSAQGSPPWLAHQRILFVAAHPDDEVIGAGAMLVRIKQPIFAYLTDAAPADLRDAGHPSPRIVNLGRNHQETSFDLAALACELAEVAAIADRS